MPRVDPYGQRRVRKDPLPEARRQAHETVDSAGGALGEALTGVGQQAGRIAGAELDAFIAQEREAADQVAQLAALRELADWKRTRLYDPEQGALQARGKDAFGLPEALTKEFDDLAGGLRSRLNQRQQVAFDRTLTSERESVLMAVHRHVADQRRAFDDTEYEAYIETQGALVAAEASDPYAVNQAIVHTVDATRQYGARNGLGPEAIARNVERIRNGMWSAAITQSLADGHARVASAYFEEARDAGQLTGESLTRLAEVVRRGKVEIEAEEAAGEIWDALGPADDDTPIELDTLEAAARARFPEDPAAAKATIAAIRSRKQGVDDARRERREHAEAGVWGLVMQGLGLEQLRRHPAFVQAPERLQVQVRDYLRQEGDRIENRRYTEESRAYTRTQRALAEDEREERNKAITGLGAFYDLVEDPATLAGRRRDEIINLLPVLGRTLTDRALAQHAAAVKDTGALQRLRVDSQVFKTVVAPVLPYVLETPGNQTPTERANLGKLLDAVNQTLVSESTTLRRALTYEEQQTLVQRFLDQQVMVDVGFWFDRPTIAAIIDPEDVSRAYVPLAEVPESVVEEYAEYLQKQYPARLGTAPLREIRGTYARSMERAYALKLLGRPNAEIYAALTGN